MTYNLTLVKHASQFGLILGATLSIFELMAYLLGILYAPMLGNIFLIVISMSVFFSTKKYRDEKLQGIISFKDAFKVGYLTCIIAGITWSVYLYFQYLFAPELFKTLSDMAHEVYNELYSGTKYEGMISGSSKLTFTPFLFAFSSFFTKMGIGGAILSLFLASLLKRNKNQIRKNNI